MILKHYLALKVQTHGAVQLVMRDGEHILGVVETESEEGLFLIDGWWVDPKHVLRARPVSRA